MTARHRLPPVPSGNGAAKLPPSVFPADPSQLNAEATRPFDGGVCVFTSVYCPVQADAPTFIMKWKS